MPAALERAIHNELESWANIIAHAQSNQLPRTAIALNRAWQQLALASTHFFRKWPCKQILIDIANAQRHLEVSVLSNSVEIAMPAQDIGEKPETEQDRLERWNISQDPTHGGVSAAVAEQFENSKTTFEQYSLQLTLMCKARRETKEESVVLAGEDQKPKVGSVSTLGCWNCCYFIPETDQSR